MRARPWKGREGAAGEGGQRRSGEGHPGGCCDASSGGGSVREEGLAFSGLVSSPRNFVGGKVRDGWKKNQTNKKKREKKQLHAVLGERGTVLQLVGGPSHRRQRN